MANMPSFFTDFSPPRLSFWVLQIAAGNLDGSVDALPATPPFGLYRTHAVMLRSSVVRRLSSWISYVFLDKSQIPFVHRRKFPRMDSIVYTRYTRTRRLNAPDVRGPSRSQLRLTSPLIIWAKNVTICNTGSGKGFIEPAISTVNAILCIIGWFGGILCGEGRRRYVEQTTFNGKAGEDDQGET